MSVFCHPLFAIIDEKRVDLIRPGEKESSAASYERTYLRSAPGGWLFLCFGLPLCFRPISRLAPSHQGPSRSGSPISFDVLRVWPSTLGGAAQPLMTGPILGLPRVVGCFLVMGSLFYVFVRSYVLLHFTRALPGPGSP